MKLARDALQTHVMLQLPPSGCMFLDEGDNCNIVTPQPDIADINDLPQEVYPIMLAKDVCNLVGDQCAGNMTRFLNKTKELKSFTKVSFEGNSCLI